MGPAHGHGRETLWHWTSKYAFARWARKQTDVVAVTVEQPMPDRARRADVEVVFADGSRVALEMQYRRLHDEEWRRRQAAYARAGIVALWIWESRLPTIPWAAAEGRQPLWFFDLDKEKVGTLVGHPHPRPAQWHEAPDVTKYGHHVPPCVNDKTDYRVWDLDSLCLTPQGLPIPAELADQLAVEHQRVRKEASTLRAQLEAAAAAATERPRAVLTAPMAAPQPRPDPLTPPGAAVPAQASRPVPDGPAAPKPAFRQPRRKCDLCGIPLDETAYGDDLTRHIDCEQQRTARERHRRP